MFFKKALIKRIKLRMQPTLKKSFLLNLGFMSKKKLEKFLKVDYDNESKKSRRKCLINLKKKKKTVKHYIFAEKRNKYEKIRRLTSIFEEKDLEKKFNLPFGTFKRPYKCVIKKIVFYYLKYVQELRCRVFYESYVQDLEKEDLYYITP
jgi:hypothetical protein